MYDPFRGQAPRARHDGVAEGDGALGHGLALDLLSAGSLDRARNARSHPEVVVGRVRDRIHGELCDVAFDDLDLSGHVQPSVSPCAP